VHAVGGIKQHGRKAPTLKTNISPTRMGSDLKFVRNSKSPRKKAGSMLPLQDRHNACTTARKHRHTQAAQAGPSQQQSRLHLGSGV